MYVVLVLGLLAAWMFQIALATLQVNRFYRRLRDLRKLGRVATGLGGNRYRGRTYAALAVDPLTLVVVSAERMRGATIFASLRPLPQVVGSHLADLCGDDPVFTPLPRQTTQAVQAAARVLLKALRPTATMAEAVGEQHPTR